MVSVGTPIIIIIIIVVVVVVVVVKAIIIVIRSLLSTPTSVTEGLCALPLETWILRQLRVCFNPLAPNLNHVRRK